MAAPLGLDLHHAAHGVFLLGRARMARAVRAVTVERGRDAREFAIVAFGGNGPLFAAEMAASPRDRRRSSCRRRRACSARSACSRRTSSTTLVRTFLRPLEASMLADVDAAFRALEAEAGRVLAGAADVDRLELPRALDLRYAGQSYELTIPVPATTPIRRAASTRSPRLRRRARAHLRPRLARRPDRDDQPAAHGRRPRGRPAARRLAPPAAAATRGAATATAWFGPRARRCSRPR